MKKQNVFDSDSPRWDNLKRVRGTAGKTVPDEPDPLYQLESTNLHARREYRVKGNLQGLARETLIRFRQALLQLPQELETAGPSDLIAEYNLAALLQVQYGLPDNGLALCDKAIELCLQLDRESGTARWTSELFQPYINIGRIAAARGETDRALGIFRQVFRFITAREDFELHGCLLRSERLAPPSDQMARVAPLFEVYLQDSLKALAWAGRYASMLSFLDQTEGLSGFDTAHFSRIIAESRARALMEIGRYKEAVGAMEKLLGWAGTDALPQPAVCVLLAEIHLQAGDLDAARNAMRQVEDHYSYLCAPDVPLNERRKFWYLVGFQYYRLGDFGKAEAAIEQSLRMNRELGDEPGILKCGILLLRCGRYSGRDTAARIEMLGESARETLYRQEQALAFYELGQFAARGSRVREAASLFETCLRTLENVGTVDARFLRRLAMNAKHCRKPPAYRSEAVSTCDEMQEMFLLLLETGVSAPLLSRRPEPAKKFAM